MAKKKDEGFVRGKIPAFYEQDPNYKTVLLITQAPTVQEILARPWVYDAWLKKLQETLHG